MATAKKATETEKQTKQPIDPFKDYQETLEARSYRGKPTHQKEFALGVAKRRYLDSKKGANQ